MSLTPPFPPPSGPPVLVEPEAATAAARQRRPWWGPVLFWGGIALMVIGLVGAVGDWAARTIEMNQLLARVEASEQAMGDAKDAIRAVTLPDDATEAQKDAAERALERASAAGSTQVERAGEAVADVSFLPWHTELIRAQAAYLDHNQAWVDYLDRGSEEPVTLFGHDNRIEPTWIAAENAVRAGLPVPAIPLLSARVDAIFEDEDEGDSGGGLPA